MILLGL